jgi:hypothetical protein
MNWSGTLGGEGFEFHLLISPLAPILALNEAADIHWTTFFSKQDTSSKEKHLLFRDSSRGHLAGPAMPSLKINYSLALIHLQFSIPRILVSLVCHF